MNNTTACPLDCYDACSAVFDTGRLKGDPGHPVTQGHLCPHLNHFLEQERIGQPRYRGEPVSMEEALRILGERLREAAPHNVLHYRGGGNMGVMQRATDHFFAGYGATLTRGSLCDGAGQAGIVEGRGASHALSPEQIGKAEVVIVWGRNPHVTSPHLLPFLKGKTIIVIDPVRTKMAESADCHIQLKPNGDLYLALLLSRFLVIEGSEDKAFLQEFASEYEWFYEMTQSVRIKKVVDAIDVTLGEIGKILELVVGKRTVILTGIGIQKYTNGTTTMRAIDAFAALLGLFGKEGCGVSYLGHSLAGVDLPFETRAKRYETVVDTPFHEYELVFIQGANPASQMPDTARVLDSLSKAGEVVYFGLYENETSQRADLVIPAKTFLGKDDVRSSYGSDRIQYAPMLRMEEQGIGEYELAERLCKAFQIAIPVEEACIEQIMASAEPAEPGCFRVKGRQQPPYRDGFETDDGEFVFLEEVDYDFNLEEGLFLLTSKSPKSLNSQFRREAAAYAHPGLGFREGARVRISSSVGSVELELRHDDRLRPDCVLIYSGTPGVNYLTPSRLSEAGENAVFQDEKIKVELC
jgi:anaerobic selenocysteine-containing dehydrogenase